MKRILCLCIVIGLLASCRSSKPISRAVMPRDTAVKKAPPPVAVSVKNDSLQIIRSTLAQLQANRIKYTTFSGKVNIDYKGGNGKNYDVNATFRMYKDSAIWVSVNAILGVEAIRLLVTKDSVKLLNKLEHSYIARSISYLQEVTSLPLNLYTLQDLLVGNPVFLDSTVVRYTVSNDVISFVSLGSLFKNLVTLNAADKSILHSKLDDNNTARSRTADLSYSNYETKKGPLFSTRRQVVVSEKTRLDVRLNFKSYTINEEVSFPFNVPKNYKSD